MKIARMRLVHERWTIAVWAMVAVVGLHVSAGPCPADPRCKSQVGQPDQAQLQKLLSAALATAGGPGGKAGQGGAMDAAGLGKMLSAVLAGAGGSGKGGTMDADGLQKMLSTILAGAGGQGRNATVDLAAVQKLLAGLLGGADPAKARSAGDRGPKALPPGMDSVLLNRAQAAMQGGKLGDARHLVQQVIKNSPAGAPTFGAAFRLAVRMDVMAKDLLARARRAKRSGDHVAYARSLLKLSRAMGETPEGRQARVWLASAQKDPALVEAVREARACQILADLAREARSARRAFAPGDLIVTDAGRRFDPLVDDLAHVSQADRKRLVASAHRQLAKLHDTPTGKRILGQLADLQAGKVPHRTPPPGRSQAGHRRSIRID